jgi:exosortase/archaeosortase family protein
MLKKGFKQFLWKTGIFVLLFIIFSIIIGSQLYQYGLLEDWKIEIYGRIGYILLFSIVGFILLYRERLIKLNDFKRRYKDNIFACVSFMLLIIFYLFEINAYKFDINIINIILIHLIGIGVFGFLIIGIYGIEFVKNFINKFKNEIIYFIIFGIIVYSFMNVVFSLWSYLSNIVLSIVYSILKLFGNVSIINPDILIFEGFAVKIAEACSGIYSIFIFSALYIFAVLLDWKKLNHKKAILMFVPSVMGAFLVNILRVFLMMIIGNYSRNIALGLYHSYTGMIFFLVYFFIFWKLSYGWMRKI